VYRPVERAEPDLTAFPPADPFSTGVSPPPYPELAHPHEERHRSRLPLVVLAVVALAAVVAATVIATVAFRGRKPAPAPVAGPTTTAPAPATPSAAASAPSGLKLRDDGDTVTLTWTDPSGGTVPFFVEAGQAGAQLRIMGQLKPGETTYPVAGLNPRLDYCFTVVAVYSATLVAPSDLVCTQRAGKPGASPSR